MRVQFDRNIMLLQLPDNWLDRLFSKSSFCLWWMYVCNVHGVVYVFFLVFYSSLWKFDQSFLLVAFTKTPNINWPGSGVVVYWYGMWMYAVTAITSFNHFRFVSTSSMSCRYLLILVFSECVSNKMFIVRVSLQWPKIKRSAFTVFFYCANTVATGFRFDWYQHSAVEPFIFVVVVSLSFVFIFEMEITMKWYGEKKNFSSGYIFMKQTLILIQLCLMINST